MVEGPERSGRAPGMIPAGGAIDGEWRKPDAKS